MSSLVVVNPTRVWVRHIKRDPAGQLVVAARFAAQDEVGVNGRQGWQTGQATAQLIDDGTVTLTFPNSTGEDGLLHRDRFACISDEDYVVGEEWIEVLRDSHEPLAVFTPNANTRDLQQISLTGEDAAAFLARVRSSEIDLFHGYSPRDVFEHYTRLRHLVIGRAFTSGWAGTGSSGTDNDWDFAHITATNDAAAFSITSGEASISRDGLIVDPDCWSLAGRVAVSAFGDGANADVVLEALHGATVVAGVSMRRNGDVYATGGLRTGWVKLPANLSTITWPAAVDLKIVARYDRLYLFANGQLMGSQKRTSSPAAPDTIKLAVTAGTGATVAHAGTMGQTYIDSVSPFAMRGDDRGDYHLPGLPTAGGVRASWLNEAGNAADLTGADFYAETLNPIVDVANSTLEPVVDFADNYAPPGLAGAWSGRLTGAVHLDLATQDLAVRATTGTGRQVRVYVGQTMGGQEAWDSTASTTYVPLRARLGAIDGWFPLRVEIASTTQELDGALTLQVATMTAGTPGAWTTVATADLSPFGCFDDSVRLETHREMLKQITDQFGYQWICEPHTLESGLFPGQVIPRVRVGIDRDVTIDTVTGSEIQIQSDAGDAIDCLIADAAGIADPNNDNADQLTVEVIDFDTAVGHLALVSDYESLSEITEENMLRQRAGALLARRSSPNEQAGVRPPGDRPVVDTFPLSNELSRMDWQPGDGARLALAEVSVVDQDPRQLTQRVWSFVPDGMGRPQVSFRDRPRSIKATMRRALRAGIAPQRNSPTLSPVQRYRDAAS